MAFSSARWPLLSYGDLKHRVTDLVLGFEKPDWLSVIITLPAAQRLATVVYCSDVGLSRRNHGGQRGACQQTLRKMSTSNLGATRAICTLHNPYMSNLTN